MKKLGLYIHIPFCNQKCPYCDFYSVNPKNFDLDLYTDKICKDIEKWAKKISRQADTLYFGGGTPSLLGGQRVSKIISSAKNNFYLDNAEITLEMNPTKYHEIDFTKLLDAGVNRLSMGLQSANNEELKALGRTHSQEQAFNCIRQAQYSGFKNISLDLMIATPNQTRESLLSSIGFCASLNIQHISAYLLKIEKGTLYFDRQDKLNLLNEDLQSDFYLSACESIERFGFKQYEISNFSLEHKESKHNLKYWNCDEYLGLGPSAHSFINNERFYFKRSIKDYLLDLPPIKDGHGGSIEEYVMLRLRLKDGLIQDEYKKRFGSYIPEIYFERANPYKKYGLIEIDNNSIKLTNKGFLLSNKLISKILF